MKSNIKKGIVFFLVGLMIMQVIFSVTKKDALAYHTENAKLVFLPMELYATNTRADSSLPAPFKNRVYRKQLAIGIQDAGKNHYEPSYCIDYSKVASTNDGLSSKTEVASSLMTNEQAMLINYAIMFGYNKQQIDVSSTNQTETNDYFATQSLIWIIKEGFFYKDAERTAIANNFIKRWPGIQNTYNKVYSAVSTQVQVPSFVNATENVMKWNACTLKFELTLTNSKYLSNVSAMNTIKVDTSTLPQGVEAKIEGDKLILTSSNEITTAFKVKLVKNIDKKGRVVAWKNTAGDKQAQVTIDYDQEAVPQVFEKSYKTETKPAVVQKPDTTVTITPQPTPQPTPEVTPQPTPEENNTVVDTKEEVFEIKEVVTQEDTKQEPVITTQLDDSPQTGDESNITIAYSLIGAAFFSMVALYLVSLINKRKQRF